MNRWAIIMPSLRDEAACAAPLHPDFADGNPGGGIINPPAAPCSLAEALDQGDV